MKLSVIVKINKIKRQGGMMNNKTVQLNAITKITTGLFIEEIVDMTLKGDSVHDMIKAGQENLNPKNNLNALHKGE